MTASRPNAGWVWVSETDEPGQIVSADRLWDADFLQLYLPESDRLVRLTGDGTEEVAAASRRYSDHHFSFAAAAARILDALDQSTLLAPLETSVIPLPHQLYALGRAIEAEPVRFLLADEVGLGKTIEAGLIMRELKLRGLVRRVLVVAPSGLVNQWVSEMDTHFSENFHLVIPSDFSTWRRVTSVADQENLWRFHDQVVTPLDSVKPVERRRGWSEADVERYNQERFEDLVTAGWDLIIVDEAHRMAGSTPQIARHQLGAALSQASPYLLLLTATPHQGKSDAFRRLISLVDPDAVLEGDSIRRENIAPLVIRTEKRRAIDADGEPLFLPRRTELVEVEWAEHPKQQALYEAVTEYVREGYNKALQEKQSAVGFLMVLMQRLVSSSTPAIRTALERRLDVLELPEGQLALFGEDIAEYWNDLDSEAQLRSVLGSRLKGLRDERREVELLLSAARQCEAGGPDAKAEVLLEEIRRLQQEEHDPDLKILVFTEFLPTQSMLVDFLTARGFSVTFLNGSLGREERLRVQQEFADDRQIMISTDAGGEGLNLQFCHVVINYDLPWNPMKLEQRIGRVDRIGQTEVVRAVNLALENSVELRVREVLEEKLERILEEFGVDKLNDVLDSEEQDLGFDRLYVTTLMSPERAEEEARAFAEELECQAAAAREGSLLLGSSEDLDPEAARELSEHQLPYWTERLTLNYLRSQPDAVVEGEEQHHGHRLHWPDGSVTRRAVFSRKDAESGRRELVSLDDPRIQKMLERVPVFAPGQPIARVRVAGLASELEGLWSLWRIRIQAGARSHSRCLAFLETKDGRAFDVAGRQVWDRIIGAESDELQFLDSTISGEEASALYARSRESAVERGREVYGRLREEHVARLELERKKMEQSFAARRRAIERVGLLEVRRHRLRELAEEEENWRSDYSAREELVPQLVAVLLLQIVGDSAVT